MSPETTQGRSLHKQDLADLRRSGLTDATIAEMGCFSVTKKQMLELTRVKTVSSPGYAIPYPGVTDQTGEPYHRYRQLHPKDDMKYVGALGDDAQLYVPPGLSALPEDELLVITEGEKKAVAAVQEGIHCVGIQGVCNWADAGARAAEKADGEGVSIDTPPLVALTNLAPKYKLVLVLGDSDTLSNPQSRRALRILASSLRKRGIRAGYAACPPARSADPVPKKQGLDDWLLADRRLVTSAMRALFYAAELASESMNDDYNAQEILLQAEDRLVFTKGDWFRFVGPHWERDITGVRRQMVASLGTRYREIADSIAHLCSTTTSRWGTEAHWPSELVDWKSPLEAAVKNFRQAAAKIGNKQSIDGALSLAQPRLSVRDEVWDRCAHRLAVKNGVIDLNNGELLRATPQDYLSKHVSIEFDPEAEAPSFQAFLERVQPDPNMREFLQRLLGYCAVGHADEQQIYFFLGKGLNGKSTFINACMAALGDYAVKGPVSILAEQPADRPRNDVAQLAGARMVSISELPRNLRIDAAAVKAYTGGDLVSARLLYREFFQFRPQFTAIVDTNHVPQFGETGKAMGRRPVVVPWNATIPEKEKNSRLPEELRQELPGILNWIVAGAMAYLKQGLNVPETINEYTDTVLKLRDAVERWLDEAVEHDPTFKVASSDAHGHFQSYTTSSMSNKAFSKRMEELGFEPERSHGRMVFSGIRGRGGLIGGDAQTRRIEQGCESSLEALARLPGGGRLV